MISNTRTFNRAYRLSLSILLVSAAVPRLSAAPVITGIANAASNITLGSPIAQGAVFVIKGSGLGPADVSVSPAPFQNTSLSGTSVSVTVNGTPVNALMYYTSDKQIAALLPSNTPVGNGTFTVTYNGQSASASHGIARNSLGVLSLDQSGRGLAIVTYPDYGLVSAVKAPNCAGPNTPCGAANPGDTLTLWATGLGPVNGDDASRVGLGQNMPNIPLTVWLGGIQAPVVYQGRSGCCVGLDQIAFTVPANVPTGCNVPLIIQINNVISNSTSVPIANGSRNCSSADGVPAATIAQLAIATSFTFGDVGLEKSLNSSGTGFQDSAYYQFIKLDFNPGIAPFAMGALESTAVGTCWVNNSSNPANDGYGLSGVSAPDGGASITLSGPSGSITVPSNNGNDFMLSNTGGFLAAGAYTVSGTGGKDVGPFNATLALLAAPSLASPAAGSNVTITRSNGMTFTWQGGDPNAIINIQVTGAFDNKFTNTVTASCRVLASQGTFTIPSYILLALPVTNFGNFYFGSTQPHATFTATGIDFGGVHVNLARAGGGAILQ